MRDGGLRPEVWCDAGGDFALPTTSSVHDLLIMLQRYAVFLYLQNLYLSTSKSCIKMGIPSLNELPIIYHLFQGIFIGLTYWYLIILISQLVSHR